MDEQRWNDQQEPIYNNSKPIQVVAWKTSWMIEMGGERGSGKSVLVVQHDDDLCKTELLEIKPFDHLTVSKQMTDF